MSQSFDGPFLDVSGAPPKIGGNLEPQFPMPPFNESAFGAIPYRTSTIEEGGRQMRWVRMTLNAIRQFAEAPYSLNLSPIPSNLILV